MSEWCMRERDKALAKARQRAKEGRFYEAKAWVDRAAQFGPVSKRQIDNVQKLLDSAGIGIPW